MNAIDESKGPSRAGMGRLASVLQGIRERWATDRELRRLPDNDRLRLLHDLGLSLGDEPQLVGGNRQAGRLLAEMMRALRIDPDALSRREPLVMRDLRRVCSLCASAKRCSRNLASGQSRSTFERYCPNAPTLRSLSDPQWQKALVDH